MNRMNEFIINPLAYSSSETLDRVCDDLNLPRNNNDINLPYQKIIQIDQDGEDLHAANAAYNAVYMASTFPEYSIPQMREHIYNLTCCGFKKIWLTPEQKELFLAWTEKIEELPGNATPFEIYYCAAPSLMHILGR